MDQNHYKAENLDNVPNTVNEKNRKWIAAIHKPLFKKGHLRETKRHIMPDPKKPYDPQAPTDESCFELVFDFGEHDPNTPVPQPNINTAPKWNGRQDAFSMYRAGSEIRTYRLCQRVLMFHHFEGEFQFDGSPFGKDYLVRSLDLQYQPSSINNLADRSNLSSNPSHNPATFAKGRTYSKSRFLHGFCEYQDLIWNKEVKTVDHESIVNAPVGLTNNYQWTDFYGEGISGILTEQGDAGIIKAITVIWMAMDRSARRGSKSRTQTVI
ncbi:MAG: hypothetical protein IPM98_13350 [Lewinellaceae bacterium]|nr:hypothetical protein [Lewinellaceae bacterium]